MALVSILPNRYRRYARSSKGPEGHDYEQGQGNGYDCYCSPVYF